MEESRTNKTIDDDKIDTHLQVKQSENDSSIEESDTSSTSTPSEDARHESETGNHQNTNDNIKPVGAPSKQISSLYSCRMSRLSDVPMDMWKMATTLTKIELEWNEIPTVSSSFSSLENLTFLNLANNFIVNIEPGIDQLKNLSHLDLSSNLLPNIPTFFSNLTNLEFLSIRQNRLTTFPDAIYSLIRLKTLMIGGNSRIGHIPEEFGDVNYSRMEILGCNEMSLSSLPASFSKLRSITELRLDVNQFSTWPEPLYSLINLKKLDLSLNDFTTLLPEDLDIHLPNLTSVQFIANNIKLQDVADRNIPEYYRLGNCTAPSVILPGRLFLGNVESCYNKHKLIEFGVTHVLSILEYTPPYPQLFKYKIIELPDVETTDLYSHMEESIAFIEEAISQRGACLVHCAAGVSRSATMVTAFIMKHMKLSFDEALLFVRSKRQIIQPNDGFMRQLVQWESYLSSKGQLKRSQSKAKNEKKQDKCTIS